MKKLLAVALAACMVAGTGAISALAFNEDDYDNLDFFTVKESNKTLYPGQDYYFETDWKGSPIDDDFFEYYKVSVSVTSGDTDDVSTAKVRSRVEKADFIKNEATGDYLFHFRAGMSFSYEDDIPVHILILAKDKENTDKRSWYDFDIDIGYSDGYLNKESTSVVDESQYDVDNNSPAIEFDKDLKQCRLDFEDGSYYTVRFSGNRKFNFGYTNLENQLIVQANPKAKLYFLSFYARPGFANEDVFKLKSPADKKYLYEIKQDNTLSLLSEDNNNGYFGFTTRSLGSYVASDIPLNPASTSSGIYVNAGEPGKTSTPSTNTGSTPAAPAGSVTALQSLVTRNFSNKFVLLSNGSEYGILDKAQTFAVSVDLKGMDPANLYLYTYDGANNRLIHSPNRPTVGADHALRFTTNTKGYYVVSEGTLVKGTSN